MKCEIVHVLGVTSEGLEELPADGVPQRDRPIRSGDGDGTAIRTQGHKSDLAALCGDTAALPADLRATHGPHVDELIIADGGQLPIGLRLGFGIYHLAWQWDAP